MICFNDTVAFVSCDSHPIITDLHLMCYIQTQTHIKTYSKAIRRHYHISTFIGESNIGESAGNCCWRHFNLAKSCSCYTYNSYETILALFKFGGQTKNRQTTKLKPPPNKLRIQYALNEILPLKYLLIKGISFSCFNTQNI